jgi:hypothetical protein
MRANPNLLITFNRPTYIETTKYICNPVDSLSLLDHLISMLDDNEKAWKITVEPTDIEYFEET